MAKRRRNLKRLPSRTPSRPLHHEALEKRELLVAQIEGLVVTDTGDRITYEGTDLAGDRNDPEGTARALFENVAPGTDFRLVEVKHGLASSHARFEQLVDGVPVFGSAASVHLGPEGQVQNLHLDTHPDLIHFKSATPTLDLADATAVAKDVNEIVTPMGQPTGDLVWYPAGNGDAVLAWETMTSAVSPSGDFRTVVDASTGEVLFTQNERVFATGTGDVFLPNPYQTQGNGTGLADNGDTTNATLDGEMISVTLNRLDDGTDLLRGEWVDLATLNSPVLPDIDASEASRIYNYTRDDPRFEQVMIYHAVDSLQEYIHSLGYDDDTGTPNGIRDFPTLANAHWDNADNSFYSTGDDAIHFGDGGVDDAEDADIILHEYGHALQHDQNSSWGGGEMGAMGEGFSDYIAASFYAGDGDPTFQAAHAACVGEWDATSYSGTNPPCLRRVDGSKVYPDDLVGQVHADGEIWSRALWDIRTAIGATTADQLILEHHFALPAGATMPVAARAMLVADENLNGGANRDDITAAFVARGILPAGPTLPPLTNPESPSVQEVGPRLIGVNPDAEEIFSVETLNRLTLAPRQLTFRFDGGQFIDPDTLSGIRVFAAGEDGTFDDGNEVQLQPGFVGFGQNQQTVIIRFAETLSDDRYRIEISGEDDTNNGVTALRNLDGLPFRTLDAETVQTIDFDVELGGQVIAVVPQPIEANDGALVRQDNVVDVYFDDADLFRPGSTIESIDFYQLVDTNETATTEDDFSINPVNVVVDPSARKVSLEFSDSLEALVPGGGTTSFRLRVGNDADFESLSVTPYNPPTDPGFTTAFATDLTPTASAAEIDGSWTLVVNETINNFGLRPMADSPGAMDEVGHRDIEVILEGGDERHVSDVGDSNNGITRIPYTFLKNESYGDDASGNPLFNQMNAAQEARFREILELYGSILGVDYYETENSGMRLIVGDLFTAGDVSGPGGVAGLGGPAGVTMDFADYLTAQSNQFGGGFFNVALHEIGHALGLDHAYDLEGAVMGSGGSGEEVFPNEHDVVHGEYLHQKEALDVDLYRIDVTEPGTLVAQTLAERLGNSSLLDTRLTLFRQVPGGPIEMLAANDDYFGSDSFVEMPVEAGTYFIGVSAEGNNTYDIESGLTSPGGVSEGDYDLRVEFRAAASITTITDADGSALDGDRDGVAGGNYNFWFDAVQEADTVYVRKPDISADIGGDGSLADPFDNIDDALAVAAASPGTLVRVLANDGADNDHFTLDDNAAYEIGFLPGLNQTLEDGRNVVVPKDTTLVIDAGAILKFLDSRISVGSDNDGVDRSGSSIQVLGTPGLPVFFTSYSDHTKGVNSSPNDDTPAAGEWGGIEIRNDVDRVQGRPLAELEGMFPNYVNHASIEFGGGLVSTVGRVIAPVHLSGSRAEISFNEIADSGNAAVSADPDTFLVTDFVEPRYQKSSVSGNGFVPDYARIGPALDSNHLRDNETNGVFIRIDTLAGSRLEPLRVTAHLDDTDIVHVLSDSLLLESQLGGPFEESVRPSAVLGATAVSGGNMDAGGYEYVITFVDRSGFESLASLPTSVVVGSAASRVELTGITAAPDGFVSRRLYRSDSGGAFRLIAELDKATSTHVDSVNRAADNAPVVNRFTSVQRRGRPDASLIVAPGLVIKSAGARIELGMGSTLLAEGTEGRNVIFTGLSDDRHGAGGTFDTNDDDDFSAPVPGQWAGIYANLTSRVSLDWAVVAYGGGVTGVEGSTAGFNALEVRQAEARVANSLFESNANGSGGQSGGNRQGRLSNSDSTIHVVGAQPTFVGNTFLNNAGSVININVNSLNSFLREDTGRQTGDIGLYEIPPANHGPVIRGNELAGNTINGMVVRGGVLYTESVWDDTDIVHVVEEDVTSTNFHTYNGLRLESTDDESLVVKFGAGAELLASGQTLDIADRIGGRVQVLGTPGNPVVLTSLNDCTVGAGFSPSGLPTNDTVNSGLCGASTSAPAVIDVVILLDDTGSFTTAGLTLATVFPQIVSELGLALPQSNLAFGITRYEDYSTDTGSPGESSDRPFILNQPIITTTTPNFDVAIDAALNRSSPGFGGDGPESAIEALWQIATGDGFDGNGDGDNLDSGQAGLVTTQLTPGPGGDVPPFSSFVADPSGPVLDPSGTLGGVGWRDNADEKIIILATDITFQYEDDGLATYTGVNGVTVPASDFSTGGRLDSPGGRGATIQATVDRLIADGIKVIGLGTGPSSQVPLEALATLTGGTDATGAPLFFTIEPDNAPLISDGIVNAITGATGPAGNPGDWQGITLDPYSHDRNVDTTVELEGDIGGTGDTNARIGTQQHLGQLAPDELSGDENRTLGFTVHGAIATDNDQDIYSFQGTAGTMVWIDIDRTDAGLDTVLEFIDGDGNVLALSEDSRTESGTGALTYVNPIDPASGDLIGFKDGHALPMQLDPEASFNAQGGGNKDFYGTNDGDSGMRVVLPGSPDSIGTYFVRVRSSNAADLSDPAQISSSLTDGFTSGGYQLQVRLSETDEIGGSVVRYADIRYATTGINTIGLPAHSPMASEIANLGDTVNLGALTNTDRAAISVSGGQRPNGIGGVVSDGAADSYVFTVARDDLQVTTGDNKVSTTIDVDYADGLSRPNQGAYLYHDGQLVAIGTNSNVLDDRVPPQIPNQNELPDRLSNGSFGAKDPYIGPLELSGEGTYEVVIATNAQVPPELLQFTNTNAPNTLVRLEPLDSTIRIADDRFDIAGKPLPEGDQGPVAVSVAFEDDASNIIPWHIGDVPLIGLTNNNRLAVYNPLTGRLDSIIDSEGDANGNLTQTLGAAAQSLRGSVISVRDGNRNNALVYSIDAEGSRGLLGGTGIQTYRYSDNGDTNPDTNSNVTSTDGIEFHSLAYYDDGGSQTRFLYGLATRGNFQAIIPDGDNGVSNVNAFVPRQNLIYLMDPDTGAGISRGGRNMTGGLESADPLHPDIQDNYGGFDFPAETPHAGTNIVAQVEIPDTFGDVTDLVTDINGATRLFAFTDEGQIWQMDFSTLNDIPSRYSPGDIRGVPVTIGGITDSAGATLVFEQVTAGPANYQHPQDGAGLSDLYYGVGAPVGSGGRFLYAFDMASRQAVPVFQYGTERVALSSNGDFNGLFFSSLDQNLWHLSDTNENVPGHGMPELDNDARPNVNGGGSLRFGFDALNDDFNHLGNGVHDSTPDARDLQGFNGYNFLGGAHGTVQSNSLDLTGMVAEDLPTLYFTYVLDSEGRNSGNRLDQTPMRDSLRVYVAGDDGDWDLVATNNFDADVSPGFEYDPATVAREYSPGVSGYSDANGRFVQQLFDGDGFRQARIDLGPWAGQEDVKIRFEFSTAGEARPDQSEIIAKPGNLIPDGHRIVVSGAMPDPRFDNYGDALGNRTRIFEFTQGGGVAPGVVPINYNAGMSITQVRDAIQSAFAEGIRFGDVAPDTSQFTIVGDGIRLYDVQLSQTGGEGLKLVQGEFDNANSLPASQFGVYQGETGTTNLVRAGQRSIGLGGSNGVYIDDIVIGLAERGESVGGAGTVGAARTNLSDNPLFEPAFGGEVRAETVAGPYQLELRTSREYNIPDPEKQNSSYLGKNLAARVEINERLARGLNVVVTDTGAAINDGDTFTLSNGADVVTFEFNLGGSVTSGNVAVNISDTDTVGEVASAIRDAINTDAINAILGVVATNSGGQRGHEGSHLETDPNIVFHGFVAADVLGGLNFGPHLSANLTGTDEFRGEDNGDRNRKRDQGQLLIDSNMVSFSSEFGIVVDAGLQTPSAYKTDANNAEGNRPKPGAAMRFPTLNSTDQIPGAVVRNNLLYNNGDGGILISGDPSPGTSSGFSRVLNNTVYGSDVGIRVDDQAAPALLNNVLMNNATGLELVNQGETLIRGTVFEGNGTTGPVGTEQLVNLGLPIFVNPNPSSFNPSGGLPNFYPVAGSPVIDNSIASQNDRALLVSVKEVVGLPENPILSPALDLYGQTRGQFFADRGAIDRLDDTGLTAELLVPLDNDVSGIDVDPRETVVQLSTGRLFHFDILLQDSLGTGPDASTVTADQVEVVENGRLLTGGADYVIGYSPNSHVLRITPTSGEWRPDSVYQIALNNRAQLRIDTVDGSRIGDGDQVVLTDDQGNRSVFEYESGNTVHVPVTLSMRIEGANNVFTDGDQFRITAPDGSFEIFEINLTGNVALGTVPVDLTTAGTVGEVRQAFYDAISTFESALDLALAAVGNDTIQFGTLLGHRITPEPIGGNLDGLEIFGLDAGVAEGQQFTYTSINNSVTFEFTSNPTLPSHVPFSRTDTPEEIAANIAATVAAANVDLNEARAVGDGVVSLGGAVGDVLDLGTSAMNQIGAVGFTGALTLEVPAGTTVNDLNGESFEITVGGVTEIFRFTTSPTLPIVGNRVLLDVNDSPDQIATTLAGVMTTVFAGQLAPTTNGNIITVGEQPAIVPGGGPQVRTSIDVSATDLLVDGITGGAIPLHFFPTTQFTSTAAAQVLGRAIDLSPLEVDTARPGGGILLLDGVDTAVGVTSSGSSVIGSPIESIADLAGNSLLANQNNGSTRFTIVMPRVELDYGDAPDSYSTTLASNGARHAIIRGGPRLGALVDSETDAPVAPGEDDTPLTIAGSTSDAVFDVDNSVDDTVRVTVTGFAAGGEMLTFTVDGVDHTFELVALGATPAVGSEIVPFDPTDTPDEIVANLIDTILLTIEKTRFALQVEVDPADASSFTMVAIDDEEGVPVGSFVGTGTTDGLFIADPSGQTSDPGDVLAFLNIRDAAGAVIPISITGSGLLDGWVDFNNDGDFEDPFERVFDSVPVVDGVNPLRIFTPVSANLGSTFARFRVSSDGSDSFIGISANGEVEDYAVTIFDVGLPVVVDDPYEIAEDTDLIVDDVLHPSLFDNDTLPSEEFVESQFTIDAQVIPHPTETIYRTMHGQVRVDDAALGLFTYTPDADYYGPDSFRYSVSTQRNAGPAADAVAVYATVNITVTPVNDAPGAADAFLRTIEDIDEEDLVNGGYVITAADLLNGTVPDADPMTTLVPQDESNQERFVLSIGTAFGTLDASNPGAALPTLRGGLLTGTFDVDGFITELLYTPSQDFNSENGSPAPTAGNFLDDEFTFTVVDDGISLPVGGAAPTAPTPENVVATAFIRVTPQNDAPELATDDVSITDPSGAYVTYHTNLAIPVPTPTEDQTLVIPSGFLLENDWQGPATAIDERTEFRGNDGPLRIVDASVDPTFGSIGVDPVTGDVTFVPADDIFGEVFFTYTVRDRGIDQAAALDPLGAPAPKLSAELETTITSRIFLEPINDLPIAIDRAFNVVEAIESRAPAAPVPASQITITAADLLVGGAADLANPTLDATASDILLVAPYNEDNQTLRVNSVTVEGVTATTTDTLTTASGGELAVEFDVNGFLIQAVYTPPVDYNGTTPFFLSEDTFTYTIVDDGIHEFPVGNPLTPDTLPETSAEATVTLTVTPANDLPVFDIPAAIDILERDDSSSTRIDNFITNVGGGPLGTALDEQAPDQLVSFTITEISSTAGLMLQDPDVSSGSFIEFFPAPDEFGIATYVVTGTDDGTPNQSWSQTFTVNVRPVNDAPRFDPAVAGTSDSLDADTSYSVADNDFDNDGRIDEATITYSLREDNTQMFADTSTPFFIPLSSGPAGVGYQQVGLLDVFTVGPDNEAGPLPGGSQELELFSFGTAPAPGGSDFTTDLGGTLRPVFVGGVLVGLNYTPPVDFNNQIGGFDSFSYEVRDNSTTGGESYSLAADALVPDRLTSANRVHLNLNPVNDRPVFNVVTQSIEVPEDSTSLQFQNYAFNITAGPQATAFDEVDIFSGQNVTFSVAPLDFASVDSADFFAEMPTIDSDTGQLQFRPAADVFGEFEFEIRLIDNGAGDIDGANARGDITSSIPVTLTIDVQPTNDPPVVDPAADPLEFTLLEDGSVEILVTGDNTSRGLLDVFFPGPANESADILPEVGGNQTVSLGTPVPVASTEGGTVQPVRDPVTGEVAKLIYTPRKDFVGMDSFIYTVIDDGSSVSIGTGGIEFDDPRIASNTVTFEVLPVNDTPQFSGAANVASDEDEGVVQIDSWANNVQAGPLTAVDEIDGLGLTPPQSLEFVFTQISSNTDLFATPPTAVFDGDSASLVYETAPDANGTAIFEVFLRDGGPRDASIGDSFQSATTTFLIDVRSINDAPSFTAGAPITVAEDSGPYSEAWATDISPGPNDESSQSVQFLVTTPDEFAHLFSAEPVISDDGTLRFTPANNVNTDNVNGPAQIEVTAVDSEGGQAQTVILPITITEVNDDPVAVPDAITTDEDTVLTITSEQLLENDIDPDLDSNENEFLTIVMPAESFSISGAAVSYDSVTGEITYDPLQSSALQSLALGETVVDSFSYSVRDAAGQISNLVTVGMTVNGINDAPAVADDIADLELSGATIIRPLDNDVDVDGTIDPLSIIITLQPAYGSVQIRSDGSLAYTPFVNFTEEDQFRYTVADDLGDRSEQALVTVSANAAPIANDDAKGTFLDEAIDIDVAANDSDPDGILDLGSIVIVTPPLRGEAIPQGNGIVQYLPEPGFVGRDSFEYRIFDTEGRGSNVARVETQVVASRLQNPDIAPDVNDDGFVTALDALLVVNHIARADGAASIPVLPTDSGPNYYDVNGNQLITAGDAIIVINELSRMNAGEGFAGEQVTGPLSGPIVGPIALPIGTGTDLASDRVESDLTADEAERDVLADFGNDPAVDVEVVDLIASDRDSDAEGEDPVAALDAALADLL